MLMKQKIIAVFALLVLVRTTAFSQEHCIEVKRFHDWGKDYLTITNGGYMDDKASGPFPWGWEPKEGCILPIPGLVITEIDGASTKDMSVSEFYSILDINTGHALSVLGKDSKVLMTPVSDNLKEYYKHTNLGQILSKDFKKEKDAEDESNDKVLSRYGINVSELIDSDYDWAGKTYDFKLSEDDRLADKNILEGLPINHWLEKSEELPDILFEIKKTVQSDGYEVEFVATDVASQKEIWKMICTRTGGRPKDLVGEWHHLAEYDSRKLPWLSHFYWVYGTYIINQLELDGRRVTWVMDESEAAIAGLSEGDEILYVEWYDKRTNKSKRGNYSDVSTKLWANPGNITIQKCKILRDNRKITLSHPFSLVNDKFKEILINQWI